MDEQMDVVSTKDFSFSAKKVSKDTALYGTNVVSEQPPYCIKTHIQEYALLYHWHKVSFQAPEWLGDGTQFFNTKVSSFITQAKYDKTHFLFL
jgi:hypothetical protein